MTVGFILNGEDVVIRTEAERRLIDILREDFKMLEAKAGCRTGICGACSVVLNGQVVNACLVPAFRVQGSEVITLEGFSQTDEYQDIVRGFAEAGAENCGFCAAGKVLAAEALISKNMEPSREQIFAAFQGIRCRCTEPESLAKSIALIAARRRRRLYGRS